MNRVWSWLFPMKPFGLFLEGMAWYGGGWNIRTGEVPMELSPVDDPTQAGPNRSDPSHYDVMGRYLWWGC